MLLAVSVPAAEPAPPVRTAVRAGRLIDPRSGAVTANAVILIEKGRVTAVGPSVAIPEGARVIDLSAPIGSPSRATRSGM
jgi:imidazolonepropionase-like amidohydrolase